MIILGKGDYFGSLGGRALGFRRFSGYVVGFGALPAM